MVSFVHTIFHTHCRMLCNMSFELCAISGSFWILALSDDFEHTYSGTTTQTSYGTSMLGATQNWAARLTSSLRMCASTCLLQSKFWMIWCLDATVELSGLMVFYVRTFTSFLQFHCEWCLFACLTQWNLPSMAELINKDHNGGELKSRRQNQTTTVQCWEVNIYKLLPVVWCVNSNKAGSEKVGHA